MGKAKTASQRQEVIDCWQRERLSYQSLSKRFNLSYNTVRNICLNYQKKGNTSLLADYSSCGRPIKKEAEKAYRLVRLVRHYHPDWGVPYILTKIKRSFPQLILQSVRNYQKRLRVSIPKEPLPPPIVPRSQRMGKVRKAHDEWQIDAKERIRLPTKEEVCFLNITDTKTNAMLKVKPFSLWTN